MEFWEKEKRRFPVVTNCPRSHCWGEGDWVLSRNQNVIFFNNKSTVLYTFTRQKWSLISFGWRKENSWRFHLIPRWKCSRTFRLHQLGRQVNSTIVSSSSWVFSGVENVSGNVRQLRQSYNWFYFLAEWKNSSRSFLQYKTTHCKLLFCKIDTTYGRVLRYLGENAKSESKKWTLRNFEPRFSFYLLTANQNLSKVHFYFYHVRGT